MKIDLNHYSVNRIPIQLWYSKNKQLEPVFAVSLWAASQQCPAIVVAFFLAESIGYIPELTNNINNLIKMYGYKQILGQKEDSPFFDFDDRV
jgi:hypothetical protein